MRFELTSRHITITSALRALVEDKLATTLRKLNSHAVSVQVVLTKEKTRVRAEATLHARGENFLHAEATGRDATMAITTVLDKVDRQASKLKSRWTEQKRQVVSAGRAASAASAPERGRGPTRAEASEDGIRIVRARRYAVKPMAVEDAAIEVNETVGAFVVFRNAATDTINVLFRRPDGHLGLIETGG